MCEKKCEICAMDGKILPGWRSLLAKEFRKEYFQRIMKHLHGVQFFPRAEHILRCFSFFECPETKVVILGQDPYHGPGQAVGLSFSVPVGMPLPPSLANIRKEILGSTGKKSCCPGGSLVPWAKQGVLLLNTTLTVAQGQPRSHFSMGWSEFTDEVIRTVSRESPGTVFMLWGRDAQSKQGLIDKEKHLVLCSAHPSPLSARKGFLGSKHFILANEYLLDKKRKPIIW